MSVSMGGYDYEFIEAISDDLICILCHLALKNPLQIEECGHIFCKVCFNQMKDHAESNALEVCCPLDRQNIDTAHVFKDKSTERRVLNLKVKCRKLGDQCEWTGELREALEHEKTCKKITEETENIELNQLVSRMVTLETKVNSYEQKLAEKDVQVYELKRKMEIYDQKLAEKDIQVQTLEQRLHNNETKMIIPRVGDETNFSAISTAFRWKFDPFKVRSGERKLSPPFYNVMNAHCFQLGVSFVGNKFHIEFRRYRGKYDHDTNQIKPTKDYIFNVHVFGKNGKVKVFSFNQFDHAISRFEMESIGYYEWINNGEIYSYVVDGYVHLSCFFK